MRRERYFFARSSRGATLLDAVVGAALMMVVFSGIAAAFRLTVDAVSNNKARAGAIALANERIEYIRSLSYTSIGTSGGIPSGAIPQSEVRVVNGLDYTRRTFVSYEDDPNDGTGAADTNHITADYKAVKVSVSWAARAGTRTVTMVTRVSPPTGIESSVPGGTLSISILNSTAQPIQDAQVTIVNSTVSPAVNETTYSDASGNVTLIGAPAGAGYQITVTKSGYSTAQTYSATAQNTNPSPTHLSVSNNQTTAATFAIDLLSTKIIQTLVPITRATSTDPFSDSNRVASTTNVTVTGGVARLTGSSSYPPSGLILSMAYSTSTLVRWGQFAWVDSKPSGTAIVYRVYNSAGTALIPDAQLPGNSTGFTTSPVNLTNISTTTYPMIAVMATLTTTNASNTPSIDSWSISNDSGPIPMPNVALTLIGAKTIGSTGGTPVYKYSNPALSSGASGMITLTNIEWDTYTTSLNATSSAYDIASSCNPQPETLPAGSSVTSFLYVSPHTTHSLLVDVKSAAGATIPGATVRVYRVAAPASDTTITSDSCGQSFFSGLSSGTVGGGNAYSISVSASGYTTYTSSAVNVSGTSRLSVILN